MKLLIATWFLLLPVVTTAQYDNAHWVDNEFAIGETYYTFGDNLSVRAAPSAASEKVAVLPFNKEVKLVAVTNETIEIDGYQSKWAKVTVDQNTTGYVASTFLATGRRKLFDDQLLLYKRRSRENNANLFFRMAISKDRYSDLGSFQMENPEFAVILKDNLGLEGIDHIIVVDYLAEACGVQGGVEYFTLHVNNVQWDHLGSFTSVADAGVFYSYEHLIFPQDDNGQPGYIIYEGEETNSLDDNMTEHRTVKRSKMYRWSNGKLETPIKKFEYH